MPPRQWTRVGAYVLCERDGALLLVRFSRGDAWTLPGGGLDHAEDPADGAVREVEEETGLKVELGPILGIDSARWQRAHDGTPTDIHALHIVYAAEVVGGELRDEVGGSTEHAEWVPVERAATLPASTVLQLGLRLLRLS